MSQVPPREDRRRRVTHADDEPLVEVYKNGQVVVATDVRLSLDQYTRARC